MFATHNKQIYTRLPTTVECIGLYVLQLGSYRQCGIVRYFLCAQSVFQRRVVHECVVMPSEPAIGVIDFTITLQYSGDRLTVTEVSLYRKRQSICVQKNMAGAQVVTIYCPFLLPETLQRNCRERNVDETRYCTIMQLNTVNFS